jgi:multiple sugar transport system substrate-binding protein
MKKIIALFCVVSMALSFSACGGKTGGQGTSQAAESQAGKPYAGKTIRVVSMTAQVSDGIQKYLSDFENKTGIKVNLELYGESELREKTTTEFLSGSSTIDVFLFSPLQDMAAYSKNGWIEPLDSYLKDPELNWSDFAAPKAQITMSGKDSIGCLPLYSSVQLMYYRKDIFEKKGLTPPKNYDELLQVCEKLNDPSNNLYAIACRGEKVALTSQFSPFLFGFGGSWIKDGKSNLSSPESIKAIKFYGKLLGKYGPPGILTTGYSQMTQLFNSGTVAIAIDANALYATLTDKAESAYYDKVGVAPIPEGPTGRQSYKQVVWGSAIYSGSKNKEAAWEFMKFVAGKDVAAYITPKGMPSFRNSVWQDSRVKNVMPEDVVQAYATINQSETTNPYGLPRLTSVTEARDAIGEAVVHSIETKGEGKDIEAKAQTASEKVDELLKKSNEYGDKYPF